MKTCLRCGYSPSGKQRSTPQNKYYWGCVIEILSQELGYTKNQMHEIIKYRFLSEPQIVKGRVGDIPLIVTKSTQDLDTKLFESLMSEIREWASIDLGIYISEPNEIINEKNERKS